VLIDAGGRNNVSLRGAITTPIHGLRLIALLPSAIDAWATKDTFTILREAARIDACAVNQVKPNATVGKQARTVMAELSENNDVILLNCRLGDREDFKKFFTSCLGVIEYDPASKAATETGTLYRELRQQLNLSCLSITYKYDYL
jgi:cellulose biosynthesis protein BcsQ